MGGGGGGGVGRAAPRHHILLLCKLCNINIIYNSKVSILRLHFDLELKVLQMKNKCV